MTSDNGRSEGWTPGEARGVDLLAGGKLPEQGTPPEGQRTVTGLSIVILCVFAALTGLLVAELVRDDDGLGDAVDLGGPNTARIHARVTSQGVALRLPERARAVVASIKNPPTKATSETDVPHRSVKPPGRVRYTIRSGGTLEDVAKMYGIPTEDITGLNPGVPLDKELKPGAKVVLYKLGWEMSDHGKYDRKKPHLVGGIPLPDGPGRNIRRRGKSWGRPNLVASLDKALRVYGNAYPEGPVVIVSDMSKRRGGKLPPHHTHREGQDVDLSYIPIPKHDNGGFLMMDERYFDVERNWKFVKAMLDTGQVSVILMDHSLQELLFKKARSEGIPVPELRRLFQYPRPKTREVGIIRHWDDHRDHMHVRFACYPGRTRCRPGDAGLQYDP